MAKLFSDGFDWLTTVADLTARWDAYTGNPTIRTAANTAFSSGQSLEWDIWPTPGTLTKNFTDETTIFGSIRFQRITAGTTSTLEITFRESGTSQVTMVFSDGNLTVRTGSNSGAIIGTATSINTATAWESYQFRIVINNTAGEVEVRRNANTTPILNITGVNTRGGTANAYANSAVYTFTGTSAGSDIRIDDVFLGNASGAEPTSWPGDVRVAVMLPSGAGASTQFSPSSPTPYGNTASNSSISVNADTIRFQGVTVGYTGTVTAATLFLASSLVGNMNVALYANDGPSGQPGTKLCEATQITNPSIGFQTFTFTSTPSLARGQTVWLGVMANGSNTFYASSASTPTYTTSNSYGSGFPSNLASPVLSTSNIQIMYGTLTAAYTNHAAAEVHDGNTSYVASSTPGHKDLYTLTPLPGLGQTIVSVEPFAFYAKSDAGARVAGVVLRSGVVETTAVTHFGSNASYTLISGNVTLDPDGSIPWTVAALNASQIGPIVVS